jgi:hypothetical protein
MSIFILALVLILIFLRYETLQFERLRVVNVFRLRPGSQTAVHQASDPTITLYQGRNGT